MANYLSAGVYSKEFDLTNVIPSVSTTIAAITGAFRWGPVNQRVLVDSESYLAQVFQTPNTEVANVWFSAANFLAYSNQLYVVRVVDETNANSSLRATNSTSANSHGFLVKNDDQYIENYYDGSLATSFGTGPWIAKFPGELGNSLKVSICPSADAYQSTLSGTLTVSANSSTVTGVGTNFSTEVVAGDLLVLNNEVHKVSSVSNTTSMTIETKHVAGASGAVGVRRWEYYNEVDIAPGTSTYAAAKGASNDEMHVVVVDEDGEWTLQPNEVLEVYQLVSKASDALLDNGNNNYYKEVINQKSKYIRWAGHENSVTNIGSLAQGKTFGTPDLPLSHSLVGGRDGASIGNDEKIRGYNMFISKEDTDISLIIGADSSQTVAVYVINNIAEARQDCIALFSPPRSYVVNNDGDETDDVVMFRNTLPSTSYAALDSGWKYQYDRYNDVYRYVPINGDIAGALAKTDYDRDPWWAAAGFERGQVKNVIKLAWNPRQAHRDVLYKNGINPIVTFPGEGTVIFGQKTLLSKPSVFDRINVRRLFIVLRKAIEKAAKYQLFDFNDDFSRAQFRNMVEPYLREVKGRRGIYDFKVVCDTTNNTSEVLQRNEFVGDIYIKPAMTAEFIRLNFIAVRNGVDFSEVVGKFG